MPENWLLYSVVPAMWHEEHWVFTSIEPVSQLDVVCPPWQLTLEHVSPAMLKAAAPDFEL